MQANQFEVYGMLQ